MSVLDNPQVKRLLKIQDDVRAACPGEDVEIVDAVAVYVNFATSVAIVIEPVDGGQYSNLTVTEWDRTGGVHSELMLADRVRNEYAPAIVKAFLEEQRRREAEMDAAWFAEED